MSEGVAEASAGAATRALPGLYWSINTRFLSYIGRMPDGRCSATDGADLLEGRAFRFAPDPAGPKLDETGSGQLRFRGEVRFAGHHGFLFVRVADPWLFVSKGEATLSIAPQPGESDRLELVRLTLRRSPHREDGAQLPHLAGTDVRLTAGGSELFNEAYAPGEPFDGLIVIEET